MSGSVWFGGSKILTVLSQTCQTLVVHCLHQPQCRPGHWGHASIEEVGLWVQRNVRDVLVPARGSKSWPSSVRLIEVGLANVLIRITAGQVVAINEARH